MKKKTSWKVNFCLSLFQAGWVCLQCDPSLVSSLESEFKRILGAPADLETWAQWLQSAVNKALENVKAKETLVQAARQFLLNWSFYRYKKVSQHFLLFHGVVKFILKNLKNCNCKNHQKVNFRILKKCEF